MDRHGLRWLIICYCGWTWSCWCSYRCLFKLGAPPAAWGLDAFIACSLFRTTLLTRYLRHYNPCQYKHPPPQHGACPEIEIPVGWKLRPPSHRGTQVTYPRVRQSPLLNLSLRVFTLGSTEPLLHKDWFLLFQNLRFQSRHLVLQLDSKFVYRENVFHPYFQFIGYTFYYVDMHGCPGSSMHPFLHPTKTVSSTQAPGWKVLV